MPGPLLSLHNRPALAEMETLPGVFFAAKKQHLDVLVLTEEPSYKIFIGHSGWGAGQLENELRQGDWRMAPATAEYDFLDGRRSLGGRSAQIGHRLLKSILKLDELPPDPTVN